MFKNIMGRIKKKGVRIGFTIGKIFNPAFQERTDPLKDIMEDSKESLEKLSREGREAVRGGKKYYTPPLPPINPIPPSERKEKK